MLGLSVPCTRVLLHHKHKYVHDPQRMPRKRVIGLQGLLQVGGHHLSVSEGVVGLWSLVPRWCVLRPSCFGRNLDL